MLRPISLSSILVFLVLVAGCERGANDVASEGEGEGEGEPCDDTFVRNCDGNVLSRCSSGAVERFDCTTLRLLDFSVDNTPELGRAVCGTSFGVSACVADVDAPCGLPNAPSSGLDGNGPSTSSLPCSGDQVCRLGDVGSGAILGTCVNGASDACESLEPESLPTVCEDEIHLVTQMETGVSGDDRCFERGVFLVDCSAFGATCEQPGGPGNSSHCVLAPGETCFTAWPGFLRCSDGGSCGRVDRVCE
jgi:hypothetical protein